MTTSTKILVVTWGSDGDIFPFLVLGHALKCEGFEVVVAAGASYRERVGHEGFGFTPIQGDLAEVEERLGLGRGGLARMMSQDDFFLFKQVIFPYLAIACEELLAASEGVAAIVAHGAAFAAHAVAEKRELPLFVTHLAPMAGYSAYDPPLGWAFPFVRQPRWRGAVAYNRALLWGISHAASHLLIGLRRFRRGLGLPGLGPSAFCRPPAQGAPTIALHTPLLAPPQPDHSPDFLVAGHTFFDRPDTANADETRALEVFLAAGEAPIVFTLGSFVVHDRAEHHRACIDAALRLKRRAVILADGDDVATLRENAPAGIYVSPYAPHSLVMPRAAVVAHHGGIGTCGQALRAGKPQLVTPFLVDQPDNAARLARLGVARVLPAKKITALALEREIRIVLDEPSYSERAKRYAEAIAREDGAKTAARWIAGRVSRSNPSYLSQLA